MAGGCEVVLHHVGTLRSSLFLSPGLEDAYTTTSGVISFRQELLASSPLFFLHVVMSEARGARSFAA